MSNEDNRVIAWLQILERKIGRDGNQALKDTGLTVMQLRIMKYLQNYPDEAQIADLSDFFDVSHTSIIHVVKVLEHKGYVYREPIRRSRGKRLMLTESGKKIAAENDDRIDRLEQIMMKGISDKDRDKMVGLLKQISGNLDAVFR